MANGARPEATGAIRVAGTNRAGKLKGQVAGELVESLWNRAYREYLNSGKWKCPEHPNGRYKGAHHWLAMDGDWVCIYCNQTKPLNEESNLPPWVLERELKDKKKKRDYRLYVAEGLV